MTINAGTDPDVSGFPIEMPFPNKMRSSNFDIFRDETFNAQNSGGGQVVSRSTPVWIGRWKSAILQPIDLGAYKAWIDSLDGSEGTFLGYDARRAMPINYAGQASSTPWGSLVITTTSFANGTLTYSGATAGFVLKRGDYVSFKEGNKWYLYRVFLDHVTGTSGTIKVRPRPLPIVTGSYTARFNKPAAEMRLTRVKIDDDVEGFGTVEFDAVQYINYETAAV